MTTVTIDPVLVARITHDARADLASVGRRGRRLGDVADTSLAPWDAGRLLTLLEELAVRLTRLDDLFRQAMDLATGAEAIDVGTASRGPAPSQILAADRDALPLVAVGLPLGVRDMINRRAVGLERAQLAALPPPVWSELVLGPALARLVARHGRARRIALLDEILAADLILDVDLAGDGRAVLAVGDPATADHVATLIPGIGRTVHDVPDLLDQARTLRDHAGGLRGDEVAVVTWLGHDAPPGPLEIADGLARGDLRAALLATSSTAVQHTATDLRRHVEALRRANPAAHQSLVGHSHGAVVALAAATGPGGGTRVGRRLVDDVVMLGAPGTGEVGGTASWDRQRTGLWHAASPTDPVPHFPVLGPPPVGPGAVRLAVGSGNGGHGAYLAAGTWGLDAVAQVVAGRDGCPVPQNGPG